MTNEALVTGGSGFLGLHLTEQLAAQGWNVRILDVRAPATEHLGDWIEADVRDATAVRHAARGVDVVYHLGAIVGVERMLEDPVACIDVTVNGTVSALEAAAAAEANLVHVSSSEVLGAGSRDLPWREDAPRIVGSGLVDRWSYASAKAAAEHVVLAGAPRRGVAATVVRPFNVYGPRQQERFVVPMMIAAALRGGPIVIHGDGTQTRCFTFVDDLVRALVQVPLAVVPPRLLHLGSTDEVSIRELADAVERAVGQPVERRWIDPTARWGERFEDVDRRVPDVRLAHEALGWSASVGLDDGLHRTVRWFRDQQDLGERVE